MSRLAFKVAGDIKPGCSCCPRSRPRKALLGLGWVDYAGVVVAMVAAYLLVSCGIHIFFNYMITGV